jgi:hypothetical protein
MRIIAVSPLYSYARKTERKELSSWQWKVERASYFFLSVLSREILTPNFAMNTPCCPGSQLLSSPEMRVRCREG